MTFWDLASKLTSLLQRLSPRVHFGLGAKFFFIDLKHISSVFGHFLEKLFCYNFVILLTKSQPNNFAVFASKFVCR